MGFARPELFWLLAPIALLFFFWLWRGEKRHVLGISSGRIVARPGFLKRTIYQGRKIIWGALVAVALIGLAGPYGKEVIDYLTTQGRIFVLSMDLSTSMSSGYDNPDGVPSMEHARKYSLQFVDKRKPGEDLIGITAYGGEGWPAKGRAAIFLFPSSNLKEAKEALGLLRPRMLGSYTSIGEGFWVSLLALLDKEFKGVDRDLLKKSIDSYGASNVAKLEYANLIAKRLGKTKQRNKVIVLFTDGLNNRGVEPFKVLWWAGEIGLKAYFIAFTPGGATGITGPDEARRIKDLLIAGVRNTGGEYYESKDIRDTARFYDEIDRIEKAAVYVDAATRRVAAYGLLAMLGLIMSIVLFVSECLVRRHT